MPITRTILDVAHRDPHRVALTDGQGTAISYRDLVVQSPAHMLTIEHLLTSLTDERRGRITFADEIGDIPVIALSLTNALDSAMLVAMLAGYRTVTSVLDPLWPVEHRLRSVWRSGAQIVITDDEAFIEELSAAAWPGVALTLDAYRQTVQNLLGKAKFMSPAHGPSGAAVMPEVRDDDEPFILIFTSGTTDLPKGFLRTRGSWRYNVGISEKYLFAGDGVVTFAPGPIAYSLTLYALIEVLGTGGTLYLQSRFDAFDAAALLAREPIERLVAVPAVLPAIAKAGTRDGVVFDRLTHAVIGGANLSSALRDSFEQVAPNARVMSYYGAAEIGFIGYSFDGDGALLEPFGGLELAVHDEDGNDVPEGEIGTLKVKVGSQGDRYISTTGGALITGDDGWASVNDQARLVDGKILLEGRAGDIAVTGGHKVSLMQIDRALEGIPGCERSTSVIQPHDLLGQIIVAVIEVDEGSEAPAKSALLEQLREVLPPQFVPHRFYTAESLPRTVGGKIRRVEVREELEAGVYTRL